VTVCFSRTLLHGVVSYFPNLWKIVRVSVPFRTREHFTFVGRISKLPSTNITSVAIVQTCEVGATYVPFDVGSWTSVW
jgi:hypothetical protein